MRIGDRITAVGLHQVVAEPEPAAMPPLGVVHAFAAPRLDHAGQHIGEFRTADARLGEYLGVVTTDMLHHAQRLSGLDVYQFMPCPGGDLLAEMENDVRGMRQARRLAELAPRGFKQVFPGFFFGLGELVPRGQYLRIDTERSDARGHEILIARLGHQRELPRHDRHDGFQRHDIRMVADTRTRRMHGIVQQILAQVVVQHVYEQFFAAREKILPDTSAAVIIVIFGDLFLVFFPACPLHHDQ